MSQNAKDTRRRLRQLRNNPDLTEQLYGIETLRAFAVLELPTLDNLWGPWTKEQFNAIAGVYLLYQRERRWLCVHDCGTVVAHFGDQCAECLKHHEEMGPVDWDCLGA